MLAWWQAYFESEAYTLPWNNPAFAAFY